MKAERNELFLEDILECCNNIEEFLVGKVETDLAENKMLRDAIVRNIEIIGEASKNLSDDLRDENPQVRWRDIMRMRDKLVHHYFRLNLEIVWQTATQNIPKLKSEVEKIVENLQNKT